MSLTVYLTEKPCACCGRGGGVLFSSNITHNLNDMAQAAGIYQSCWRPEDVGFETASALIEPLSQGLELLKSDPDRFRKFDSPNGWGLYDHFVPWVEGYLEACREHPDGLVEACR